MSQPATLELRPGEASFADLRRVIAGPVHGQLAGGARERILALQQVLASKAPPWLAKVMGQAPEERIRFEREGSEA